MITTCDDVQTYGITEAAKFTYHVETLFRSVVPELVAAEFGGDEAFREGCRPSDRPIELLHESVNVAPAERASAGARGETSDVLFASLMQAYAVPEAALFNVSMALNAASDAARKAEYHRSQINADKERLKRLEQKVGPTLNIQLEAERIKASIVEHTDEADRFDNIVADLDERIQAHRMAA